MASRRNQEMEYFNTPDKRTLVANGDGGMIGISRIRLNGEHGSPVSSPDIENAVVAHLHLRPQIAEISIDGRSHVPFNAPGGHLNLLDFRRRYEGRIMKAYDFVAFHIPFPAFDDLAPEGSHRGLGSLTADALDHMDDAEVRGLVTALLPAFDRPRETSRLFLDHVGCALVAHIGRRYGVFGNIVPHRAGLLEPWQEQRAKEMIDAHMSGDLRLADLARACGLSVGHFTRAFRRSCGVTPHRWLLQRRIDRAQQLLFNPNLSLAVIASECGFCDQSHLSRVFSRLTGLPPGHWRRERLQ